MGKWPIRRSFVCVCLCVCVFFFFFFGGGGGGRKGRVGGRDKEKKKSAIITARVQNLAFCLIGRKTKDPLSHVSIGYVIACFTSEVISKLWRPRREMRRANFPLLLLRLLKTSSTNR